MGNEPSSISGSSKSRRSRQSSSAAESATDRARKVVGDLQATLQSSVKKLEEQDHPAAQLIDSVCGQYFDQDSKLNGRHSRSASFYSEDVSEDDSRTLSEDDATLDTDYRPPVAKKETKKKEDQSVESSSYQSDYASEVSRDEDKNKRSSSSGKKKSRSSTGKKSSDGRTKDDDTYDSEGGSSYTPKGVVTDTNLDVGPGQLSKPLASAFAKRCYFTKAGIGKSTQHYEGLTLTGNVVLMLAAAMKLKGCPTICDEDLRRVEQTYPNQFSRLPDELLLSSGWRRISKYCHFSNKPVPDGIPFFHSKQRLHPTGGYFFLLAAAVGMVRPIDVEPLTRDTLVLLETDYPTQCDAAPQILIKDPDQWTLVDKFCFFSGGPINTDEDVYYQADFDGNPIYMLAFLSPSLTPEELYKLDSTDTQGEPGLKSVAAVEEVESVYDLTDRDFHDLKLYHLGPCRALPQYILQPQAWTKVLPPHFLAARQRAILIAQDYEARHGVPQMPMQNSAEHQVDPTHQLTVGATPLDARMLDPSLHGAEHYPGDHNYYLPTPNSQQPQQQMYDQQTHQPVYAHSPLNQQPMYDQSPIHQPVYDQGHQHPMYEQPSPHHHQPVYDAYNTSDAGSAYPAQNHYGAPQSTGQSYMPTQGMAPNNVYPVPNEGHHIHHQHHLHQQFQQQQEDNSPIDYHQENNFQHGEYVPEEFQRVVEEEGAFVGADAPMDEAYAAHVSRAGVPSSAQPGIRNNYSGMIESQNGSNMESPNLGFIESYNSGVVNGYNVGVKESYNIGAVESHNSNVIESHNSGVVDNQSSGIVETINSGAIDSPDSAVGPNHNSSFVESRNSGLVESHNSRVLESKNSRILTESRNNSGLADSHNNGGIPDSHDSNGIVETDSGAVDIQSMPTEESPRSAAHSTTHSEDVGATVDEDDPNNYSYHVEDDLEAQRSESQEQPNSPYSDEEFDKTPHTPQGEHLSPQEEFSPRDEFSSQGEFSPRGDFSPQEEFSPQGEFSQREEQYYDSPGQQDSQHEFFGTPSVEQPDEITETPPDVHQFVEDEFGHNRNDFDDRAYVDNDNYGGGDFGDNYDDYKGQSYGDDDFDGEDYDENEFERHNYNGGEYYESPEKTVSDGDSAEFNGSSSPIRMDHLRQLRRKDAPSPPSGNEQLTSPSSEYSHTSAMRGAQELLKKNRQRRQERAQKQNSGSESRPDTDDFDPSQGGPSTSPQSLQSRTEEESASSAWESGSELTSVISGSSVWTDNSNPNDRSSRRALILQMAKARMKSNKEREDKVNTTIAEELSESGDASSSRPENGGAADIDFSADLD